MAAFQTIAYGHWQQIPMAPFAIGTFGGLGLSTRTGVGRTTAAASTNGGLPDDRIKALALDLDGAIWVGTY